MLFVGLGNPGKSYESNRHNVGFMLIDSLSKEFSCKDVSKKDFQGELLKTKDIYFLKPHTYMNLSGESVLAVMNFFKLEKEDLFVIHDDLDLNTGTLRYKIGGSSGGHNGLKSIDSKIGNEYKRARIGIGRPERKSEVSSYVLSDFGDEEKEMMDASICFLKDAILRYIDSNDFERLKLDFSKSGEYFKK